MSIALKIEGNYQGFIYFDAVTQYTPSYSGKLTSHPIGSGGVISDHFIRDNPTYQFSGIISAADISVGTGLIIDDSNNRPMNYRGDIPAVNIKGNNRSLISLVPQTISQFFVDAQSSVISSVDSRENILKQVRTVLESLFKEDGITLVKLFNYQNLKTKPDIISDLVVVNLSFDENPDTGQALYVNISLEKPTFTTLQSRKLTSSELSQLKSATVAPEIKTKAAEKIDAGKNPVKAGKKQSALYEMNYGADNTPAPPPEDDALMKFIKERNVR
jgi:hypothetical protein